jgi:transposase
MCAPLFGCPRSKRKTLAVLNRERLRLVRERTGHINRIKGLLLAQGIRGIEPKQQRTGIDFGKLATAAGVPLAERMIETQLRIVEKERDTADAQDTAAEQKRELLCALQGVGGASAAILTREVFARQFASRQQLGFYLGLTPSAYDSGSATRCQGISKAGNSWARRVLIEVHGSGGNTKPAVPCLTGMPARPQINRRGSGA